MRYPAIANAGIKRIVNGPFTFSPDGNPLVGPVPGLKNFWVACGTMAGFVQGGGVGRSVAEWIVQGQATVDVYGMDIARFDPALPQSVVIARAKEFYGRRFDITYPNETWPVGRPQKTSPLYSEHKARGAVFLSSFGYEGPAYFAPPDGTFEEVKTFGRSNAFAIIAQECRAARAGVAIVDVSAVAKFRIGGPDAQAFLHKVIASPLPTVGRALPALVLSIAGKIIGDATVAQLSKSNYLLIGPAYMQEIYMRWFSEHRNPFTLTLDNVSEQWGAIFLTGPRAVAVLDAITNQLGSGLGEGAVASAPVGFAPCHVLCSRRTGDVGFDIYTPLVYLFGVYEQIQAAGAPFAIRDIGIRAYASMAMEQSPGVTLREMSQDYTVGECGYTYLLDNTRNDYVGHDAVQVASTQTVKRQLVALRVQTTTADPGGDEPVWRGDEYVGHTTSGQYGHTVGYAMAMAFIDPTACREKASLSVTVLGQRCPASIVSVPFQRIV